MVYIQNVYVPNILLSYIYLFTNICSLHQDINGIVNALQNERNEIKSSYAPVSHLK